MGGVEAGRPIQEPAGPAGRAEPALEEAPGKDQPRGVGLSGQAPAEHGPGRLEVARPLLLPAA